MIKVNAIRSLSVILIASNILSCSKDNDYSITEEAVDSQNLYEPFFM